MAEVLGDNERRDLYRKMLNDAVTAESTRKYSLKGFEKRLLGDQELIGKISDLSIRRGWAIDENDFVNRYVPELKTATTSPAPKPQAAPVAPAPVEEIEPPIGIAAPKPLAEPIPSVTDIGREMAFKPVVQQPVKPVGVMAPEPIEEPVPSVTEITREAAFKPPVQPKMPKEEEATLGQKAGQTATELISGFNRALLKTPSSAVKTVSELGVGLLNMMGGNMESEDAILYSLADKYDKWLDTSETAKKFVGSPEYTGLATDVGSGLGQIFSMIAAAPQGVSKALISSPGVLKAVSQKMFSKPSLIAFSQVFNSEFENMKAKGESEQTAFNQGLVNAMATSPLENLPLVNLAERLNKTIGVKLARRVMNALQQGAEEGGQEAIQQIFSNLTNNQLVKSEENIVDWARGVQPSAEAGGVVGLLVGGLANAKAARKYKKKPEAVPQAETAATTEPPVVPISPQPPVAVPPIEMAPAVEPAAQAEDELGFVDTEEIQLTPEERDALLAQEETSPTAPAIAPLNIDFTKNEGRNVNYQGIEGRVKIDSDGAPYVFTKDGDVVYIEGGLSGQTPQQLGVQPLADDVINEADVETVLQDENAPLDQNQLEYDFDNNTVALYGKPFTYEGVETNSKGQTTALRLRDANGKVKFVRNEDTILEFEIQKELYEKSRTNKPATIESATAAAEQLQVVPTARPKQVSKPVQQERPVGNIEGDEVAPAEEEVVMEEVPTEPIAPEVVSAAPVEEVAPEAPAAPKKSAKEMSLEELKAESEAFDEKIKAEKERLKRIAPTRQIIGGADIENLSEVDAARYSEVNDELARRTTPSQEEAKRRVAEKREQRRKEQEPTAKKIDKKSVQASLDKAKEEYEKAKSAFDKKRSELDKTTREDVKDLFGQRKVEMKAQGLFEMPRVSPGQREKIIQPFRDRMNKAKEEVNRLTKMLEEGEEVSQKISFNKAVEEIKSKPLSHVFGIKMGSNQAEGTYISTEKENRYAKSAPNAKISKAEVSIENPLVVTDDIGLVDLRNKILNRNLVEFTEEDFELYEIPDEPTVDDLNESGVEKLSKLVTKDLKAKGYDSIYFPESKIQEGELIVFDRKNVKFTDYEQVQRAGEKVRERKGTPKAKGVVRPKAKPIRNAGKSSDAITARSITFYSDPIGTSLQYIMDATYHPDLLESIFGGPSRTTKSGRKDISGERKARIQFLDKNSPIKTADRLAEILAERYAEENNIDVKDAEQQHDFASIATDIISSYSSRNQIVRELLRLNEQQNEEFEFMYNPEAIYGEGYNEDIAKEIDGIMDELPDSYWEGREITDEEFNNLFAEEVEPETKEGKKAEAKEEKGRVPEEPTKKGVRFEKGKKLTEEEKKEVYKNLKDSYKEMKRPYTIETRVSQYTGRDYEARVWLENASDYMQTSDVTGRKLRYYIFLPDGTLAHPTEIFPNISPSEMTRVQRNVEYNERQANEKMDDITSQLKKSGEMDKVVKAIETALKNGAEFVKEYDSGDVGQKNPLVMLRFPNGRKWGVPQYVINTQDSILGFTQKDVVKDNLGESREKIFDTNYQPDWEQFYNNNKQAEAKPEATLSFTSQQSSEAATAFDKAKTSKGFDKKYGKGAYKALSDITKNFEDIMDKVSEKIKQDCII